LRLMNSAAIVFAKLLTAFSNLSPVSRKRLEEKNEVAMFTLQRRGKEGEEKNGKEDTTIDPLTIFPRLCGTVRGTGHN